MRPKIKKMTFDELADNFEVVSEQEQASCIGGLQNGCFWKSLAFINGGGYAGYGFCVSTNNAAALALAQGYYGYDFDADGYGGFTFNCWDVKRNVANSALIPGVSGSLLTFNPSLLPSWNWEGSGGNLHTVVATHEVNRQIHVFCPQTNYTGIICRDELERSVKAGGVWGFVFVRGS